MSIPDPRDCPQCRIGMEPSPLAPDPEALVCPGCGVDQLALRMQRVAGGAMVWDYRDVRFYLRWDQLPPTGHQLAAARKLVPALRRLPHGQLATVLGTTPAWEVGVLPSPDARALFVRALDLGLKPELVYLPETRGTSVDQEPHEDEPEGSEDEE